jgi:hypothetical protein
MGKRRGTQCVNNECALAIRKKFDLCFWGSGADDWDSGVRSGIELRFINI